MGGIFKDPARQASFDSNGYVIVDLLDDRRIARLLRFFHEELARFSHEDLFESSRYCGVEENFRIMDLLRRELEAPAEELFTGGTLFGGTFMVKVPETSTMLPLHQDWSVVDEDRYQSAFIWCALVDCGPKNGCLFAVPGSHRCFANVRGGNMPSVRIPPTGPLAELVVDLPLRAGQAVIYLDRLFHGSHSNRTREPRIVCTGRLNQEGATLVYCHRTGEDDVEVIAASPRFYLTEIGKLARGESVPGYEVQRRLRYRHEPVTGDRLITRLVELDLLPSQPPSSDRAS